MAEKIGRLDLLLEKEYQFRSTSYFKKMLNACRTFKNLAPYNALLVYMQRPNARYVQNTDVWKENYRRRVNEGASPVIVLFPFGPVDYLFDIQDTLPYSKLDMSDDEILRNVKRFSQYRDGYDTELLCKNSLLHGIKCNLNADLRGEVEGAAVNLVQNPSALLDIPIDTNLSIQQQTAYIILIDKNIDDVNIKFYLLVSKLAAIFCRHLPAPNSWRKWKDRRIFDEAKWFEIETVVHLIFDRLNLIVPGFPEYETYLDSNFQIPQGVSIERIFKAFDMIWTMLEKDDRKMKVEDGLLYKRALYFEKRVKDARKEHKKQQEPTLWQY